MRIRMFAVLLLVLLSAPLPAQQTSTDSSHTAAAAELVEVLELEAAYEHELVEPPLAAADPRAGEAYEMVLEMIEEFMPWSALEPEYVSVYKAAYSEREIRDLIEFYRTPLGRKVVSSQPRITRELKVAANRVMMPHMDEIMSRMVARVRADTGMDRP